VLPGSASSASSAVLRFGRLERAGRSASRKRLERLECRASSSAVVLPGSVSSEPAGVLRLSASSASAVVLPGNVSSAVLRLSAPAVVLRLSASSAVLRLSASSAVLRFGRSAFREHLNRSTSRERLERAECSVQRSAGQLRSAYVPARASGALLVPRAVQRAQVCVQRACGVGRQVLVYWRRPSGQRAA